MSKIIVKFTHLKYGDSEAKSIPRKSAFLKWQKIENRPVGEIPRKGSDFFLDITTETFHTSGLHNKIMFLSSILKKYR